MSARRTALLAVTAAFLAGWLSTHLLGATPHSIWGNSTTDQDRCQAEADYMAKHNIFRHVGPCIGRFEGIGRGYSPKCGTCTPRYRMTLTGDAAAKCSNGMWIRVRSWR